MPMTPLARARLAPRGVLAALALTLSVMLLLAAATPASAVTRKQATKSALAALGSTKSEEAVVVFGLTKPVSAGTRVTRSGSTRPVARVGSERAWVFYEETGPFVANVHRGRVALVGVKSGKVRLSRMFSRAPRLNGKLPAFMTTYARYRSPKYRVFAKDAGDPQTTAAPAVAPAEDPIGTIDTVLGPNSHPKSQAQDVRVKQDRARNITLTGTDENGDFLTFEITKAPDRGTLSGQPPHVTYTPDPGYLGTDRFWFRTHDGFAHGNTAPVSIQVVPLGSAPVVTTSAGCTDYTEQSPAVVVDGQIAVSDSDDTVLDSARVQITSNFERGDDLVFTDQAGISGSYDDVTGTLTLSGTATLAAYQAALRSVGYRNLSSGTPATSKEIGFTVNDAGSDSAPATKPICITEGDGGANNRPVGETSEGVLDYIENDGPLPVDAGFFVVDADSTELSGATVEFTVSQPGEEEEIPDEEIGTSTAGFAPAEDELAFTDQNGITGSYDDTLGVMTLSGTASIADYEAAIRSVTYENSSEDPSAEPRTLRFTVTDSSGATSVPSNRGVFVTPVNDAPVVSTTEGSASATGDDPATAIDPGLTAGDVDDTDLEGAEVRITSGFEHGDDLVFIDQLGISGAYNTGTGVLTLSGTASEADYEAALRSIEFRHPGGNPAGARTVEFTVNDGDLDSAPASKDIQVNDKPVLDTSDSALAYTENDGAVAVDNAISATDADSDTLVGATVQITANFSAAEDELAFAEQNGITGSYDDESGTLTLTGSASVADYQAALGDVRYENSSDTPSAATRTVTFQADDGGATENLSDPVTRDIEVAPVNDKPVLDASDGALAYTENDGPVAVDTGISAADVDSDTLAGATVQISSNFSAAEDELAFADQTGIAGVYDDETGTLTLSGAASVADYEAAIRSVTYENSSQNPSTATRTVSFQADDGGPTDNLSDAVTRDVEVTAVNDAPALATSEGSTAHTVGDPATTVDANIGVGDDDDTNLESAQVRVSSGFESGDELVFVDQLGIAGVYDSETGVLTMTGSASIDDYQTALASIAYDYTGEAAPAASKTVEFVVNDGDADSNTATKTVDVTVPVVNEAPVVTTSDGSTSYTLGDTTGVEADNALTVTDADDTDLEGAAIQIAGFEPGDDLVYVDQLGITGNFDSETGVLTLIGTASVASYETALRSVKFRHFGDNQSSTRTLEFRANDGDEDSATAFKTIDLAEPPPPPPPEQ